jgi:hypothetical protein
MATTKQRSVISKEYRDIDGYWIELKPGYIVTPDGTHGIVEDTKADAYSDLSRVVPCDCDDCKAQPGYIKRGLD